MAHCKGRCSRTLSVSTGSKAATASRSWFSFEPQYSPGFSRIIRSYFLGVPARDLPHDFHFPRVEHAEIIAGRILGAAIVPFERGADLIIRDADRPGEVGHVLPRLLRRHFASVGPLRHP
jgi:hypothetical protein